MPSCGYGPVARADGMEATMSGKAFEEGKMDHGRGLPRTACAYELGTPEFTAWNEGWGEAMSVAAKPPVVKV